MRYGELREAVVSIDMMAAAGTRLRPARGDYASGPGPRGAPAVMRALDLASEYSRSPNETRTRLIWVLDARLPPPRCNQAVFDLSGRLLGFADLLDLQAGLSASTTARTTGARAGTRRTSAGRNGSAASGSRCSASPGSTCCTPACRGPDARHAGRGPGTLGARGAAPVEHPAASLVGGTPPSLDEILERREALWDFHAVEREG